MEATKTTTEAKKPVRQIKTAGTKQAAPQIKAQPKAAAEPKKAPAPKVNAHIEAGVSVGDYEGVSSMINANRKTAIRSIAPVASGDLTTRQSVSFYALRKAYGNKPFPAKGFDNGILANLIAAGLLSAKGGVADTLNGATYTLDGATPVMLTITPSGQSYGKP